MPPLLRAGLLLLVAALPLRAAGPAEVVLSIAQLQRVSELQLAFQEDPAKADAFAATSSATVDALCAEAPPNCKTARSLLRDVTALVEARPVLGPEGYDATLVKPRAHRIAVYYTAIFSLEQFARFDLEPLLALLVNAVTRYDQEVGAQLTAAEKSLGERLIILEGETAELEAKTDPTQAEVSSLKEDNLAAFDAFKSLSLGIDSYYEPEAAVTIAHREKANGHALKLAELRDRLIALEEKAGLTPSPVVDLSTTMRSKKLAELLMLTRKKKLGVSLTAPAGDELGGAAYDQPVSPRTWSVGPTPMSPAGPVKLPGTKTPKKREPVPEPRVDERVEPTTSSPEQRKSDFLRLLGLAQVAGEPKKRALLVHGQSGNSCAIVAQQQLLLAYGVVPGGDPQELEDLLESSAAASGYYSENGGTPNKYLGDLLLQHGLLIAKHSGATDDELAAAAKTGKMLLVSVDSGVLWDEPDHLNKGHAVLITGVSYRRKSGEILGYYINDSGYNGGVGGWFIPAERFLKAWRARGSRYVEVL